MIFEVELRAKGSIPMRIAVTDPIILPKKHRNRLEELEELKLYNSLPASLSDFFERIKDAEILLLGKVALTCNSITDHLSKPFSHFFSIFSC